MSIDSSRRRYLAGLGSIAVTSTAGCAGFLNRGKEPLDAQLKEVEGATERYKDPKKALKDGFKLGGPYVPGMGWHFSHPERLKKAAKDGLDIKKPPMLTYLDNDHTGGLKLAAVEYGLPAKVAEKKGTPDLFHDEDADATEKGTHIRPQHTSFRTATERRTIPRICRSRT